jgi:hypothetical protein
LERKQEKERERESFTEILSFLEIFSPHVEIQYIFYRALSLQKGENLSTFEFLSLSLSLPSFSLLTEVSCTVHHQALIMIPCKKASMPSRIMPKSPLMLQGSKKLGAIL